MLRTISPRNPNSARSSDETRRGWRGATGVTGVSAERTVWRRAVPRGFQPVAARGEVAKRSRAAGASGYRVVNARSAGVGVSTQSATKTLVSRESARSPRRLLAKTSFVPSGENIGKASNVPE